MNLRPKTNLLYLRESYILKNDPNLRLSDDQCCQKMGFPNQKEFLRIIENTLNFEKIKDGYPVLSDLEMLEIANDFHGVRSDISNLNEYCYIRKNRGYDNLSIEVYVHYKIQSGKVTLGKGYKNLIFYNDKFNHYFLTDKGTEVLESSYIDYGKIELPPWWNWFYLAFKDRKIYQERAYRRLLEAMEFDFYPNHKLWARRIDDNLIPRFFVHILNELFDKGFRPAGYKVLISNDLDGENKREVEPFTFKEVHNLSKSALVGRVSCLRIVGQKVHYVDLNQGIEFDEIEEYNIQNALDK